MSFILQICDLSVPYCASLEAWNWVVAGQQRDSVRAFDLIPKLKVRPE